MTDPAMVDRSATSYWVSSGGHLSAVARPVGVNWMIGIGQRRVGVRTEIVTLSLLTATACDSLTVARCVL